MDALTLASRGLREVENIMILRSHLWPHTFVRLLQSAPNCAREEEGLGIRFKIDEELRMRVDERSVGW